MPTALENLKRRFPNLEPSVVADALREADGHAGHAAACLRRLSKAKTAAPRQASRTSAVPLPLVRGSSHPKPSMRAAGSEKATEKFIEIDPAMLALANKARASADPIALKNAGNTFFKAKHHAEAIALFGDAIDITKKDATTTHDLAVLYANRAAVHLVLKKYVRAGYDARISAELDPKYWKAHWRHARALMKLSPKLFRTRLAIESLQACLECGDTLPEGQRVKVQAALRQAAMRLQSQDAATKLPDNCAIS